MASSAHKPFSAASAPIWNSQTLAAALNVNITEELEIYGVSADSRTIEAGFLFVALKGEQHNGNLFAESAFEKGAVCCIVDENLPALEKFGGRVIVVDNTLEALNKLAIYKRNTTKAVIVGVTGSVGKTSTKEMLYSCFDSLGNAYVSHGNFNNHFGLPLCMSNMPEDTQYGVFELGMNHQGEIAHLSNMARPHVSIVTTVEAVHLEFFSSVAGIAEAKAEIFEGMAPGGHAVINIDNPYNKILAEKAKERGLKIHTFGRSTGANYKIEHEEFRDGKTHITLEVEGKDMHYELNLLGEQHALNSAGVLACIHLAGADVEFAARRGISNFKLQAGRGEITLAKSGVTVIDETYNASPASVRMALINLGKARAPKQRTVAVLADMRELGSHAPEFHKELAATIEAQNIDKVYCIGALMQNLYDALPEARKGNHTATSAEMAPIVCKAVAKGDLVLVKGSNSMKTNLIVEALKAHV